MQCYYAHVSDEKTETESITHMVGKLKMSGSKVQTLSTHHVCTYACIYI